MLGKDSIVVSNQIECLLHTKSKNILKNYNSSKGEVTIERTHVKDEEDETFYKI